MSDLTYGELFAGAGGLGMGVQSVLGGRMAWAVENDPAASRVLDHWWPDVPNLGDITAVDWATVEPVDVITGGSPCQDVSHAGRRAGMRPGTRSGLWASMCDAVDIIRPGLVVWENVRGALSAEADSAMEFCSGCVGGGDDGPVLRALGRVLGDLAELRYDAWWVGLRAADVGAAHGRFRVFVFATPADSLGGGRVGWPPVTLGRSLPRVASAGSGQVARAGELTLLPTPAVNDMGEGKTVDHWDAWTAKMQAAHGNGNGHGKSLAIEVQRLLPTPNAGDAKQGYVTRQQHDEQARAKKAANPNLGGLHEDLALIAQTTQNWGGYAPAIARWEHVLGRPAPAPTEPGKTGNPRLSPRFVEWMLGLPAGHVTHPDIGITRNAQLKILGNGVVPQQAAAATAWWVARRHAEQATSGGAA